LTFGLGIILQGVSGRKSLAGVNIMGGLNLVSEFELEIPGSSNSETFLKRKTIS
jgi:hypothetical protein